MVVAWVFGRKHDALVEAVSSVFGPAYALVTAQSWAKTLLIDAVAAVVAAISVNLFSCMIHEAGWGGVWRKHPLKTTAYALLIILSALTIAYLHLPSPGHDPAEAPPAQNSNSSSTHLLLRMR